MSLPDLSPTEIKSLLEADNEAQAEKTARRAARKRAKEKNKTQEHQHAPTETESMWSTKPTLSTSASNADPTMNDPGLGAGSSSKSQSSCAAKLKPSPNRNPQSNSKPSQTPSPQSNPKPNKTIGDNAGKRTQPSRRSSLKLTRKGQNRYMATRHFPAAGSQLHPASQIRHLSNQPSVRTRRNKRINTKTSRKPKL